MAKTPEQIEAEMTKWVEHHNRCHDLGWLSTGIEEQARAALTDENPERKRLAESALMFLDGMRREISSGNMEDAAMFAMKAGAAANQAGLLIREELLKKKHQRRDEEHWSRILELREKGFSYQKIACQFTEEGRRNKDGNPFTKGAISATITSMRKAGIKV